VRVPIVDPVLSFSRSTRSYGRNVVLQPISTPSLAVVASGTSKAVLFL